MDGPIITIYQDTLHAQVALMKLRDGIRKRNATLQDWNAAEDELQSALDRFTAYRAAHGPMIPPKYASPGLAGVSGGASSGMAATQSPAPVLNAVPPVS
jgi:hypothetical protein